MWVHPGQYQSKVLHVWAHEIHFCELGNFLCSFALILKKYCIWLSSQKWGEKVAPIILSDLLRRIGLKEKLCNAQWRKKKWPWIFNVGTCNWDIPFGREICLAMKVWRKKFLSGTTGIWENVDANCPHSSQSPYTFTNYYENKIVIEIWLARAPCASNAPRIICCRVVGVTKSKT